MNVLMVSKACVVGEYRRKEEACAGLGVEVLRRKGYRGSVRMVPQFGVDPEIFSPHPASTSATSAERAATRRRSFNVGYAGRLTREKGIDTLLRALRGVGGEWQLRLVGS